MSLNRIFIGLYDKLDINSLISIVRAFKKGFGFCCMLHDILYSIVFLVGVQFFGRGLRLRVVLDVYYII